MAQFSQTCKPSKLVLDKATKYLTESESFFLLNHDVNNSNAFGKATPMAANYAACDIDFGAGENYAPNTHYDQISNQSYSWHYNSNGVHFISRISGDGNCEIVYSGDCLQLSADPKHEITQWRAMVDTDYYCNKVPGGKLKRLIWVDGTDTPMACLDVEASIATNFFTTPFFDLCGDPCAYIQMCVPEIKECITGEWVPVSNSDNGKGNLMLDKGFKFAIRHIYYDGRASELSDRSILYYQDSKGCFDNSDGYPRCMKFRLPIGNPMVEKTEFYVSEDGGYTWFLRDTIDKYKKYNSTQQYWYQRELSEVITDNGFSTEDCSFDYIFCNDKQRIAIDPLLLTRVTNPIPREAQGIVRIKDTIAPYNYISGTCPVDKNELDKIRLEYNCNDIASCKTEYAEVTVRAVIYNHDINRNGAIIRANGASGINVETEDDLTDPAAFFSPLGLFGGYNQVFSSKTRNFIVYIEGTDYWGQMEQWRSTPNFASVKKVGTLAGCAPGVVVGGTFNPDSVYTRDIGNGNFYYQEYVFTVPKGTKGFLRLASHHQTSGAGDNQNTSTQVTGIIDDLANYTGTTILVLDGLKREIYFDTCGGDVDIKKAFIIDDLYEGNGTILGMGNGSTAYFGYITNKEGLPIEGAKIYKGDYGVTTDYNGYYVINNDFNPDQPIQLSVHVEQSCTGDFTEIEQFSVKGELYKISQANHSIQSQSVIDSFYVTANVVVNDCNGKPIRGVRVAMSGSKYKVTDSDGIAHFIIKNYSTRNRSIVAVVMDKGGCFNVDCFGNCNPCMPSTSSVALNACFIANPTHSLTLNTNLNTNSILSNKKTLKKGGIYDMAIVVEGDCGKLSAAYPITTFNIPRLQETGTYSTCDFTYNINGALFPSWATKGKIVRSANLNPFILQWVVDKIIRTSEGKMILTIQSLNDYNARYNFKTNTVYQFLQGDSVEFIRNGDGKVFDTINNSVLNYQILSPFNDEVLSGVTNDVKYFNQIKITDDGKLENLKEGAIIQINALAISTPQVAYYEICANFSITNGEADIQQGTFETSDTYLINRQIDSFPPQYFESKTPSDFWGGTNLDDTGKVHFLNPYENEKRYPRNFSINSSTQLNYFGDFIKKLDAEEQGAIIAVAIKDDNIGLAICENDNFLFQVSDQFLRVSNAGVIMAAPVDSIISNPDAKVRGEYGCQYQDIGGIYFGDGFVLYPCEKASSLIIHNYSLAQKCGLSVNKQTGQTETSCQSFFQKRMQLKANSNKNATNFLDHYRYSIGQNKMNSVIHLTLKTLRQSGVNNEKGVYLANNDTIMYSPLSDMFLGFCSATPEGYSQLQLNTEDGCAMLMFQNSLPYITPINTTVYNEFFGISCSWYVAITLNKFPTKIKVPLAMEIQSEQAFITKEVTTEQSNFRSEIPAIKVKRSNGKWNCSFLNDINSRGGLFSGSNARSFYVNILLQRDETLALAYGTVDPIKQQQYGELDLVIIKFMNIEQSGLSENL